MFEFRPREEKPEFAMEAPDCQYWDIWDEGKKIGWFGVFVNDNKQFTDIWVHRPHRGKGYFKKIYDYFIANFWNGERLCAFIGHGNDSSARAHEKYGCKVIKQNQGTDIYLVKSKKRKKQDVIVEVERHGTKVIVQYEEKTNVSK